MAGDSPPFVFELFSFFSFLWYVFDFLGTFAFGLIAMSFPSIVRFGLVFGSKIFPQTFLVFPRPI